ncbi:hypothetical protein [Streptomyces sp. NPDC126499]|uniref:hypothetical protein n=1 Tax=Streptomyces sp. NPDC126499 TaxID=3155314 RepID=UPI003325E162
MGVQSAIAKLVEEAEQQVLERMWEPSSGDRALAFETVTGLSEAVGAVRDGEDLADIQRLAHLREALAALAITLARTHGRLAWFLAACIEALSPILHWRALPAGEAPAFGTTHPTPEQLADAEDALRDLAAALNRIAAVEPDSGSTGLGGR